MPTTSTGEDVLAAVIRRSGVGKVILNAELDAIAAGTITSVLHLAANKGTDEFYNWEAYRPGNATGMADYVRKVTTVTSAGVASIDRNVADTTKGTENLYLLKPPLTARGFLDAFLRALRLTYFDNIEPLSTKPSSTSPT